MAPHLLATMTPRLVVLDSLELLLQVWGAPTSEVGSMPLAVSMTQTTHWGFLTHSCVMPPAAKS